MNKILVTGISGFIGYSLAEELAKRGYEVWGIIRLNSTKFKIPKNAHVYVADLTDKFSIDKAIKDIRPNIVFHLAAITPVSECFSQPMLYTETNYLGTISLADSCIKYCEDLQAFIYASTSEVYGNQDNLPISENNNPRPNTPYAISKYASELYLKEYLFKAYEFPVIIARPFNTYGRALVNQPHYIVEKIIVEMLKDSKEITLGNPKIKRDFMFRDDHVNAYLSILNAVEKGKNIYGEAFNFCTGQNITIESLAIMLIDLIGWSGNIVWNTHIRPNDIDILWGDCSKAKNVLGWIANHSLKSGLVKAINEWKEVLELKYSYMPSYIIKSRWRRKSRS